MATERKRRREWYATHQRMGNRGSQIHFRHTRGRSICPKCLRPLKFIERHAPDAVMVGCGCGFRTEAKRGGKLYRLFGNVEQPAESELER